MNGTKNVNKRVVLSALLLSLGAVGSTTLQGMIVGVPLTIAGAWLFFEPELRAR